jgi:hypothetical protein
VNREGVELGSFSRAVSTNRSLDYVLDDETNDLRLRELSSVELVVSTVTTFGLDAAAAGVPVLQLALENAEAYPGISSAARNAHLLRYLSSLPEVIRLGADRGQNRAILHDALQSWYSKAQKTTERLHHWLTQDLAGRAEAACWDDAVRLMVRGD